MSVQHPEPANPRTSDPVQSAQLAQDDAAGAATLAPLATVEQLTQALQRQQVELEAQRELLRHTQAALAASEERLKLAQEGAEVGVWDWDVLTGALYWAPQMERLYGQPIGTIHGYADWSRCVVPEDLARIEAERSAALAQRIPFEQEFRIIHGDGSLRWLSARGRGIYDETGSLVRVTGINLDITQRKQTEAALLDEQANIRALLENTDGSIWSLDVACRLLAGNRRFFEDTRHTYGRRLATGDDLLALDGPPQEMKFWRDCCARAQRGEHFKAEIQRQNANARWSEYSFNPIRNSVGDILGITVFGRDITERKQEEEARARLQAQLAQTQQVETVGRLASGIAHDFNNMLAVILLRTDLALQSAAPDTPLHRNLTAIAQTAQRSAEQVRNLLGFARRQVIAPRAIDLNEAVASALPMLHRVIGDEIELVWRPGASLSPVKLDPAQIDQMLANLCINARDAIGGAGVITMETANVVLADAVAVDGQPIAPGAYVLLAVRDTGSGLDAEAAPHLFDPYFRTTTVGTGLGLATVDGIMQQNGGQIQVSNDPGGGKTINLIFPPYILVNG